MIGASRKTLDAFAPTTLANRGSHSATPPCHIGVSAQKRKLPLLTADLQKLLAHLPENLLGCGE
jgi:hypothetical protein